LKLVFHDSQETSNPLNGSVIEDEQALTSLLESLRSRPGFVFELLGDNGYMLCVGLRHDIGFVQYSQSNGELPYLVARIAAPGGDEAETEDEVESFLCGDTPTEISREECVPYETLKEILLEFVRTGTRSSAVSWKEI